MTGSANYGTYESTEEELDTFLRHSIKPFMKRRLNELDSLRAKNEHLEEQLRLVRSVAVDFAKSLPRVITADEIKAGQHFASFLPGADIPVFGGQIDMIEGMDDGGLNFTMNGKFARIPSVEKCTIVLLADAPEPRERTGREVSPYELQVGDVVDVWHGDDNQEPYYPAATIESASPLIADQFDFEGLERSFPRFEFRLVSRPTPGLPTETGAVIEVTGLSADLGRDYGLPLPCVAREEYQELRWEPLHGRWSFRSEQITSWRPMKVVPSS